jgi:hypothetical protein
MAFRSLVFLVLFALINPCLSAKELRNTLVLSFCSMSRDYLPYYSKDANKLENIQKIFDKSFIFLNSYSNVSWSNLKRYMARDIWKNKYRKFDQKNENALQSWSDGDLEYLFLRVPSVESIDDDIINYYKDNRLTSIDEDFNLIKETINNLSKGSNKISIIHMKFMHYPYLSQELLSMANSDKYFDENELKLIEKYRKDPKNYPDKKVFFQVLFAFKEFENFFTVNGKRLDLTNEKSEILKWKQSLGYEEDYKLLRKVYSYRLSVLDKFIGKVFEYYTKNFENKLNFVLAGDHGESFMQHDSLTHSGIPYDESIGFFYSLHLSSQKDNKLINNQISQKMQEEQLFYLTKHQPTIDDFETYVQKSQKDESEIFSYSCSGEISSLRIDNKWKSIYNVVTGDFKLFELPIDPLELNDVSSKYPEISLKLKLKQTLHLEKITFIKGGCINSYNF